MPHGKKPTSHKTKLLNPTAFMTYLGLRQDRTKRNTAKGARRARPRLKDEGESLRSRARYISHRHNRRARRRS